MDPALIATVVLFSVIGSALGMATGLIPGIHVNTLASVMLVAYPAMETSLAGIAPVEHVPIIVCSLIMSASVVHSFMDFVPSVFIGAPDGEDALSMLPGHRLLHMGEGMKAVRSAAIGSLIGCSAAICLAIPLQIAMGSGASDLLDRFTKTVLLGIIMLLFSNEYSKGRLSTCIACFLLSGAMGYAVMKLPIPAEGLLGEGTLLMPMLTGLFGLPMMLTAASGGKMPKQRDDCKDPVGFVPGLKGVLMGTVAGWFPGITSTVGATVSATVMPDRSPERFIATVASIGTVTTILSLVTLSINGGGRSGTVIVIGQILGASIGGVASQAFVMMLIASAVASVIGYCATIGVGRILSGRIGGSDQRTVNRIVIAALIALVALTTGPWGMVVLAGSTLIGFIPVADDSGRIALCGCLMLPVLLM